jgi:tetratricopeptide (TPR) repeat protein
VLGNRGSVLEGQERYEEAVDAYKQSAQMFEQIGDSDSAMYVWQAISRLRLNQKQWLSAIAAYEEGVENMPDRSLKKGLLRRILRLPGGFLRG